VNFQSQRKLLMASIRGIGMSIMNVRYIPSEWKRFHTYPKFISLSKTVGTCPSTDSKSRDLELGGGGSDCEASIATYSLLGTLSRQVSRDWPLQCHTPPMCLERERGIITCIWAYLSSIQHQKTQLPFIGLWPIPQHCSIVGRCTVGPGICRTSCPIY
jgi:hypothetical protein